MSWGRASEEMRRAMKQLLSPRLRELGFKGSFPHFYRPRTDKTDLLSFQFSQFSPALYIVIASCGARGAHQPDGSVIPVSQARTYNIAPPMQRRIGPQPSINFSHVASLKDAVSILDVVTNALSSQGDPWWNEPTQHWPT